MTSYRSSGAESAQWPWLLILTGLMAGGAVLRFATLGDQSLGHDEATTVGRILLPGLCATVREVTRSETTPHLYYVLAWLWTRAFGTGAVGVRSLSALLGTLTIPVAFGAARAAVFERAGVMAAALVAVDPFLVYYSQEARSYALFALLAACSLWAFAAALRHPSTRALIAWALAAALALTSHYFAVFLIAGEALWLVAVVRPLRRALLATALPVLAGGALLPVVINQATGAGVDQASLARQLPTALVQFMFGERLSISGLYSAIPVLGSLGLLVAAFLTWLAWRWRLRTLCAFGTVGLFALLVPLALSALGGHYFNARNCIGCLIALLILLASVLSLGQVGRLGVASVVLLGICGLVMSLALNVVPVLQRPDYRDAAALLGRSQTGQRALVISPGGDTPTLLYRASHDPTSWPATAEQVSEIDVLAANDSPPGAPPPSGFRVIEQKDTGTVRVTRLIASAPRLVSRDTLTSLVASAGRPILLLETHG